MLLASFVMGSFSYQLFAFVIFIYEWKHDDLILIFLFSSKLACFEAQSKSIDNSTIAKSIFLFLPQAASKIKFILTPSN